MLFSRTLIFVYIAISASSQAFANISACSIRLGSQEVARERLLEEAGELEVELERLISESRDPDLVNKAAASFAQLQGLIETIFNDSEAESLAQIREQILALEVTKSEAREFKPLGASISWNDLIENPKLIEARHSYPIDLAFDRTIRVEFSADIVNTYFHTTDVLRLQAGKKFLKAIQKGFIGKNFPTGTSGIKPLVHAKDVFEVRIVGDQMPFRLGGYLHNNTLHLVYQANGGNHSARNYLSRFVESVRRARITNGH